MATVAGLDTPPGHVTSLIESRTVPATAFLFFLAQGLLPAPEGGLNSSLNSA